MKLPSLSGIKNRGAFEFNNFRAKGIYEAGRLISDRAVQRLCLSRFRTAMRPSLHQLVGESQSMHMSALELVKTTFPAMTPAELDQIEEEYTAARAELRTAVIR